jgi:ribosomal-protein-alanine N-acetyltransferase
MTTERQQIPILHTERLTLRAFDSEEITSLESILSDRETIRYFPRQEPWPHEIVEKWVNQHWQHWQDHGYGWWAIASIQDDQLLGWCGLNILQETGETEVLYLLKRSVWGQGLASEAAQASVDYGFRVVKLEKIVGLVHPENFASQRVLEKCGLRYEKKLQMWGMDLLRYIVGSNAHLPS